MKSYKELYEETLKYLNYNHPFFYTYVVNLGNPSWSKKVETMELTWNAENGVFKKAGWEFTLNPDFVEQFSVEDLALLVSHNALHIALRHNFVYNDNKSYFTDETRFNIAADCVNNDILKELGFETPSPGVWDELYHGPDVVGYNTARVSLFTVYDDIPDETVEEQKQKDQAAAEAAQQGDGGGGDQGDQPGYSSPAGGGSFTEENDQTFGQGKDEDLGQNLDGKYDKESRTVRETNEKTKQGSKAAGSSFTVNEWLRKLENIGKGWIELLKVVNPDITKAPDGIKEELSFAKKSRKLAGFEDPYNLRYGVLPHRSKYIKKKGDKPTLVMFMDCSGSCAHYTDKFLALANGVPKEDIHLMCWTFSTRTMRLDLDKERQQYATGGTDFQCIENAIQKEVVDELGKYPKSVIVVTDGEAGVPNVPKEMQDRWHWLILNDGGYYRKGPFGHNHMFNDVFKGMKF